MKKPPFFDNNDKGAVQKIIADLIPFKIREGLVVRVASSGAVEVQVSGSAQNQPAEVMRGLDPQIGDRVFMVRSEIVPLWFIFGVGTVRAINGDTTASSSIASGTLLGPTSVSVKALSNLIVVNWTPSGVRSDLIYQVEISSSASPSGVMVYVSGSVLIYPAAAGTTRYFRVRAVDNAHNTSGWSAWIASTSSTLSGLTVKEEDASPTVVNVNTIKVANSTLTDHGAGVVSISTGGGGGGGVYAPLVTGDTPGPVPIATGDGQFIMVRIA